MLVTVGDQQYRFVAGTSDRFRNIYLGHLPASNKATALISCAELYHAETENLDFFWSKKLLNSAAKNGKAKMLKWGLWLRSQ